MFWGWQQHFKIYFYSFERRWVLFWNYVWILSWFWVVPACITVNFIPLSLDLCHFIPQRNLPILIKYLFRSLDKEEVITTRLSTWIIMTSIRSPVQFSGRNSQSASSPVCRDQVVLPLPASGDHFFQLPLSFDPVTCTSYEICLQASSMNASLPQMLRCALIFFAFDVTVLKSFIFHIGLLLGLVIDFGWEKCFTDTI